MDTFIVSGYRCEDPEIDARIPPGASFAEAMMAIRWYPGWPRVSIRCDNRVRRSNARRRVDAGDETVTPMVDE